MSTLKHQFVISSRELADWLDSQPDCWWVAGPDDLLVSKADFPCPSDELAAVLRQVNKNIIIHTDKAIGIEDGRLISGRELPLLADTQNRYQNRDFLASWEGSDKEWLLTEDKWAAKAFGDDAMEEWDGEDEDRPESED
jgi:hypothetical protein